ncbi:MAG: mono-functional DNA-alkylating methyl methanesulfonate N-term-domain-containing protein [Linnemannia gamsii]|nr:MAG: mono-functional DNA-alkylating methyl methanesulfonate N-term-domain-containing protein [Linnemannia gamsii]
MEGENQDSLTNMEEESQDDYESMEEDSSDSYEEMEDESHDSSSEMEVESTGDYSTSDDWEIQSDKIQAMEDEDLSNANSGVWVYAKHLQSPGAFQQACFGQWAPDEVKESSVSAGPPKLAHTDVVLGKGSYISLCRFTEYCTEHPSGSWEVIHEQPIFGTLKDLKAISIDFEEEENSQEYYTDARSYSERPRMGYLPESASKTLLVATSDTGFLTFLAFHYEDQVQSPGSRGYFYAVKKIDIAEPGHDMSEVGARVAIDSTNKVLAVSGLLGNVRLFFLEKTRRSSFDPVGMISSIGVKGTIIAMDFLYMDPNAELVIAILGIMYFNKDSGKHYISTFHIGASPRHRSPPIHVGTSELGSNHLLSALLLKGLPDLPYCMVYVDEESVTYVTTEQLTAPDGTTTINHTHHTPLKLMKKEPQVSMSSIDDTVEPEDTYPLITACATPPRSSTPDGSQTLYLGSDTADFYRININGFDNTMHFELHTGERPIGRVMEIIAGDRTGVLPTPEKGRSIALHTDYLLYSSEHGNGSVLGVKEEVNGTIGVFSVSELPNDAPVLDFCADEPVFPGRDSLFVCSGMKSEGCIKRVRSGVVVNSSGSSGQQRFGGATGVWSVKEKRKDPYDSFLVISFIQSTKLMKVGEEGEFEDVSERCGLELSQATIASGRLMDGAIFQVHRAGVVAVLPQSGRSYKWTSGIGVLASASWVKEGTLVLGQILSGESSIIVLELAETFGHSKAKPASYFIRVIASIPINAEPTTIYCWDSVQQPTELGTSSTRVQCCVGTLEPAIHVFSITQDTIDKVYTESLDRESVAVPHSISVLRNGKGPPRILVGLRNGSIIVYEWNQPTHSFSSTSILGRIMLLPRLFNLGVMPVKFAYSGESSQTKAVILSDKIWQAGFNSNEFEVQPILSDNEVSQACAFEWQESENLTRSGFVFIVDHQDLQLVTLEGKRKYDFQALPLSHTPRRLLNITSKGLLIAASVGDGFPFAESILQLIDPARVSNEPGSEKQHVVGELATKQGEGVFCLTEWKVANKTLICVGTGIFSPTGAASSAASPRSGRLIVLSIKHLKPRGYELIEEWTMEMSMPVFAIAPFMDNKILVSSGPMLKLFTLSTENSLLEKASARERWPIVQISSQGKMIVTGSRGDSISFYEYEAGSTEHSFDKLRFFRSARSARQVSDCLAITPELAVGVDLSGCIFGVGYTPGDVNQQYSLVDQFSFNMGEIVTRIRLAKLWQDEGRSLSGIPLPLPTSSRSASSSLLVEKASLARPPSLVSLLIPHILVPWTLIDSASSLNSNGSRTNEEGQASSSATTATTKSRPSSQALVGYSLVGSIFGIWRLEPPVYNILKALQHVLATFYESRPVLGGNHGAYRSGHSNSGINGINGNSNCGSGSQPTRAFHTIDGDLIDRFLGLDHAAQIEVMDRAIRLEGMVEEWIRYCDNKGATTTTTTAGRGSISAVSEALDRELAMTNCNEFVNTEVKCVDRAYIRRSMYLSDDGRFLRGDCHVPGTTTTTTATGNGIGQVRREGSRWDDEDNDDEDDGEEGDGKPLDFFQVPCRAIHVLCTILIFLRKLDWHQ